MLAAACGGAVLLAGCSSTPAGPAAPPGHAQPWPCAVGSVPAATKFVGLTEGRAAAVAGSEGLDVRVIGRDGRCSIPTGAPRADRLNLYVVDGKVDVASRG